MKPRSRYSSLRTGLPRPGRDLVFRKARLIFFDDLPGIWRLVNQPGRIDHAEVTVAGVGHAGRPVVYVRDLPLEAQLAKALGQDWLNPLDRYVCDCGAATAVIRQGLEGLSCPRCAPGPPRVA